MIVAQAGLRKQFFGSRIVQPVCYRVGCKWWSRESNHISPLLSLLCNSRPARAESMTMCMLSNPITRPFAISKTQLACSPAACRPSPAPPKSHCLHRCQVRRQQLQPLQAIRAKENYEASFDLADDNRTALHQLLASDAFCAQVLIPT